VVTPIAGFLAGSHESTNPKNDAFDQNLGFKTATTEWPIGVGACNVHRQPPRWVDRSKSPDTSTSRSILLEHLFCVSV
jgi:hypothetical protein